MTGNERKESAMGKETRNEELLARYLQAVRVLLPPKQRQDVGRELEENLRSEIEEKEAERGRPLDEEELGAVLKRLGHPALLALRYQQGRWLIGPAVFPLYWFAVKVVLGILAVVHILLPAIVFLVSREPAGRIVGLFLHYPAVALPVLAWITIAFAVLDTDAVRTQVERALSDWSPRSLPPLVDKKADRPPSVAGLVFLAFGSVWWLASLQFPVLMLGPAADTIAFGPIFYRLYVPMIVAAVAGIALGWTRLARPHWTKLHRSGALVVDALGLAILYVLSRAGEWFVLAEPAAAAPAYQRVIDSVNLGLGIGLTVGLVATGLTFAWKHLIQPACGRRGFFTRRPTPSG
jgi:hypothetical protein